MTNGREVIVFPFTVPLFSVELPQLLTQPFAFSFVVHLSSTLSLRSSMGVGRVIVDLRLFTVKTSPGVLITSPFGKVAAFTASGKRIAKAARRSAPRKNSFEKE